jgi:thiol-disulfide isomerase/thioredoxin
MKLFATLALTLIIAAAVSGQNEQAPILEKDITYNDWTLKSIRDSSEINLRKLVKGNKLVAVVYFAPWCPNWKHDAPMLERLYRKYKSSGLEIVAVGEYDPPESMKKNFDDLKLSFPAVYESGSRSAEQSTTHFRYRKATGDKRRWGSPYYVFIDPNAIEKTGEVLLKKTNVINGEMIELEGERFIRQRLGLPAELPKPVSLKSDGPASCDPATPADLKPAARKP